MKILQIVGYKNSGKTTLINELWTEYEITPNNAKQFERPTNIKKWNF